MVRGFTLLIYMLFPLASYAAEDFVLRSNTQAPISFNIEADGEGLKVFWWNVACSSTRRLKKLSERDRADLNPVNQWQNIETLVKSNMAPDVVILGEYCPRAFQQKTYDLLKAKYKHIFRLDKANDLYRARNGFRVFSKYKIKVTKKDVLTTGDFLSSEVMQKCFKDKGDTLSSKNFKPTFWDRPLLDLKIEAPEKTYSIAPVHLSNPWRLINACLGRWDTAFEMLSGTNNPNYNQAVELVDYFSEREAQVLIGDFNAPKSVALSTSNSYYVLKEAFGPSVVTSDLDTFVDLRSGFGSHILDHAFVSNDLKVEYADVLPFAGSDHLPIYISIR